MKEKPIMFAKTIGKLKPVLCDAVLETIQPTAKDEKKSPNHHSRSYSSLQSSHSQSNSRSMLSTQIGSNCITQSQSWKKHVPLISPASDSQTLPKDYSNLDYVNESLTATPKSGSLSNSRSFISAVSDQALRSQSFKNNISSSSTSSSSFKLTSLQQYSISLSDFGLNGRKYYCIFNRLSKQPMMSTMPQKNNSIIDKLASSASFKCNIRFSTKRYKEIEMKSLASQIIKSNKQGNFSQNSDQSQDFIRPRQLMNSTSFQYQIGQFKSHFNSGVNNYNSFHSSKSTESPNIFKEKSSTFDNRSVCFPGLARRSVINLKPFHKSDRSEIQSKYIETKGSSQSPKQETFQSTHPRFAGQKQEKNYCSPLLSNIQQDIKKKYPNLMELNIPRIEAETGIDRFSLHSLFSKFKSLLHYKYLYNNSKKLSSKECVKEGIEMDIFKRGIQKLNAAPDRAVGKLFEDKMQMQNRKIGWSQFIKALKTLYSVTDQSKIELFLKIIDENANGFLSFSEVFQASKQVFKPIFSAEKGVLEGEDEKDTLLIEQTREEILETYSINGDTFNYLEMSEFLARYVFDSLQCGYDQEIPTELIESKLKTEAKVLDLILKICFQNIDENPREEYDNHSDEEELTQKRHEEQRETEVKKRFSLIHS